jgi:hypothetical protein
MIRSRRKANKHQGPLMLVCFTNHALDQFLEKIIELFKHDKSSLRIVRLGGRSKNEELNKYKIHEVARNSAHKRTRNFYEAKDERDDLSESLN